MGLAHEVDSIGSLAARRATWWARVHLVELVRDGLLVASAVVAFGVVATARHGWAAMTDSGRAILPLVEFSGFYLFLAFAAATLWMAARASIGLRNALEKVWMQGFVVSVVLLFAAICLVPPIWE